MTLPVATSIFVLKTMIDISDCLPMTIITSMLIWTSFLLPKEEAFIEVFVPNIRLWNVDTILSSTPTESFLLPMLLTHFLQEVIVLYSIRTMLGKWKAFSYTKQLFGMPFLRNMKFRMIAIWSDGIQRILQVCILVHQAHSNS